MPSLTIDRDALCGSARGSVLLGVRGHVDTVVEVGVRRSGVGHGEVKSFLWTFD